MTGRAMRWDKAAKRDKFNDDALRGKQIIPVKTDEAFWKSWRGAQTEMRAAGYRVRKVDGKWQAWIER
jgi:hypothetical protein